MLVAQNLLTGKENLHQRFQPPILKSSLKTFPNGQTEGLTLFRIIFNNLI